MIMFVLRPLSRADPSVRVPGVVQIKRGDIPNPLLTSSTTSSDARTPPTRFGSVSPEREASEVVRPDTNLVKRHPTQPPRRRTAFETCTSYTGRRVLSLTTHFALSRRRASVRAARVGVVESLREANWRHDWYRQCYVCDDCNGREFATREALYQHLKRSSYHVWCQGQSLPPRSPSELLSADSSSQIATSNSTPLPTARIISLTPTITIGAVSAEATFVTKMISTSIERRSTRTAVVATSGSTMTSFETATSTTTTTTARRMAGSSTTGTITGW